MNEELNDFKYEGLLDNLKTNITFISRHGHEEYFWNEI